MSELLYEAFTVPRWRSRPETATGRAQIAIHLEQERDYSTGPVITIAVVVQGIEQYAWLTLLETRALHHALDDLLTEAENTN